MSEAVEEKEWRDVKKSLSEEDTDYVKNQLHVMGSAEVVRSDGDSTQWYTDIDEKYEELVEGLGGEDAVSQYLKIEPEGVAVAVEYGDEPVFVVYGSERIYEGAEGPKIDYDPAV